MKKIATLLLVVMMMLQLTACGEAQDPVNSNAGAGNASSGLNSGSENPSSKTESDVTSSGSADASSKTESDVTSNPEPGEEDPSIPDGLTQLSKEEVLSLIPALPQAEWSFRATERSYGYDYSLLCETLTLEEVQAYIQKLIQANIVGDRENDANGDEYRQYQYVAKNKSGAFNVKVSLSKERNGRPATTEVVISLYKESRRTKPAMPHTKWGHEGADAVLPELPEEIWKISRMDYPYGTNYRGSTYYLTKEDMLQYVDALKQAGFIHDIEEKPEGEGERGLYSFKAKDASGKVSIEVKVSTMPYDNNILSSVEALFAP